MVYVNQYPFLFFSGAYISILSVSQHPHVIPLVFINVRSEHHENSRSLPFLLFSCTTFFACTRFSALLAFCSSSVLCLLRKLQRHTGNEFATVCNQIDIFFLENNRSTHCSGISKKNLLTPFICFLRKIMQMFSLSLINSILEYEVFLFNIYL